MVSPWPGYCMSACWYTDTMPPGNYDVKKHTYTYTSQRLRSVTTKLRNICHTPHPPTPEICEPNANGAFESMMIDIALIVNEPSCVTVCLNHQSLYFRTVLVVPVFADR